MNFGLFDTPTRDFFPAPRTSRRDPISGRLVTSLSDGRWGLPWGLESERGWQDAPPARYSERERLDAVLSDSAYQSSDRELLPWYDEISLAPRFPIADYKRSFAESEAELTRQGVPENLTSFERFQRGAGDALSRAARSVGDTIGGVAKNTIEGALGLPLPAVALIALAVFLSK